MEIINKSLNVLRSIYNIFPFSPVCSLIKESHFIRDLLLNCEK